MKNKAKTNDYKVPAAPLVIEYLHQKYRGVPSYAQKNSRVVSLRRKRSFAESTEIAESLGNALAELFDAMENAGPARALKLNHRSITGWISGGSGEEQVQFESTLERDFAYLANFDNRVIELQAQPFTLKYQNSEGNQRRYTPDFSLAYLKTLKGYSHAIVEVKYKEDLEENYDDYAARFEAMEQWCAANDSEFHIVTEEEIRGTRIDNVKALYPFNMAIDDDPFAVGQLGWFVTQNGPMRIGDILDQRSKDEEERARVQHNLWWLIGSGGLWVNLDEPITFDTLVYPDPVADSFGLFFSKNTLERGGQVE